MKYALASIVDDQGPTAAVVVADRAAPLERRPAMSSVIAEWDTWRRAIDGQLADGSLPDGRPLSDCRLLPPVTHPPNLFMLGANYADHAREMGDVEESRPVPKAPEGPFIFLKPTGTLVGQGASVEIPRGSERVDWEVELAAVIGRPARHVRAQDALEHVFGYTVINDVSVRDRFRRSSSPPPMAFDWFRQKGWATTCPCGPVLVPACHIPEPGDLRLTLTVNDELQQNGHTSNMIFDLPEQIAFLSEIVALQPGDIISTGTPAGVGMSKDRFLQPGDRMVAEVEGIGRLENPIIQSTGGRGD